MGEPIYYIELDVAYKKNKSIINKNTWVVSKYKTVGEIMNKDHHSMKRLEDEIYGSSKNRDRIMIKKIHSVKQVGTTSY